jgi:hypothetical protein
MRSCRNGKRRFIRIAQIITVGLCAGPLAVMTVQALSPPPPLPIGALEEFYEAMNGDDWHRNDGWLDDEVDVCDWYGITCVVEGAMFTWIGEIRLPNNNLSGELTPEVLEGFNSSWCTSVPSRLLDLSGNAISGSLAVLPRNVQVVRLADNQLTGPLPEFEEGSDACELHDLNLAGNAFEGTIPESWTQLNLDHLDLGDNRLEGDIAPAVAAMALDETIHLRLAGNQFTGPIPEELMALDPHPLDGSRTGPVETLWSAAFPPGLDLCWNDFDAPDAVLAEFIDFHHHGGGLEDCQEQRQAMDPTVSGSWFDPERNGEGFVHHLLENGQVLLYWFTFPRQADQQQAWHFGVAPARESSVRFEHLYTSTGRFNEGRDSLESSPFRLSVNPVGNHRQTIDYSRSFIRGGSRTGMVSYGLESNRADHVPLTRLAGSTCDNQLTFYQGFSGAWYDPERDGEGFVVEVNEDGRAVVYWFTHTPDGSGEQAWMMGDGEIKSWVINIPPPGVPTHTIVIDSMVRPTGTRFGTNFDPDDIVWEDWGRLAIDFFRQGTGHVYWDSNDDDFGTGDHPIERLARPMLAECD